jgi:hypothetical protein
MAQGHKSSPKIQERFADGLKQAFVGGELHIGNWSTRADSDAQINVRCDCRHCGSFAQMLTYVMPTANVQPVVDKSDADRACGVDSCGSRIGRRLYLRHGMSDNAQLMRPANCRNRSRS